MLESSQFKKIVPTYLLCLRPNVDKLVLRQLKLLNTDDTSPAVGKRKVLENVCRNLIFVSSVHSTDKLIRDCFTWFCSTPVIFC